MLRTFIKWLHGWNQRYHSRELARRRALGYDDAQMVRPGGTYLAGAISPFSGGLQPLTEEEKMKAWNSRPWKGDGPLELGKTGGFQPRR
jgi:hypothetical protein